MLNIDIEYLLKDFKRNRNVEIVKSNQRNKIVLDEIVHYQLSTIPDSNQEFAIEAFLIEIKPGLEKGSPVYGHKGKELGLILSGEGEFLYGTDNYILKEGDCISFTSDIPHILKNTG